ncbi:MAG TPA: DUF4292 domain-containing protein [Sandaracinaceae bacterium LLY-WYZ-13_1]|nr:DUF4292 domain-containing protein [Sandaracinaceae bacterium LLY-WYZ-13_1]
MSARLAPLAVAGLTAVLAAGCPARPCPATTFTSAERAVSHYRDMRRPVRVLRAEARVDRRGSEGRIRGTVLMFVERPDHVRFDAMTQIMGAAAVLTSDGQRFALMDLQENRFYVGPTCPANIERLLGLRFSGDEVTRLLLGDTPLIEHEERDIHCEDGAYRVTLHGVDGRRQELVLEVRERDLRAAPEAQRMRLRRSEVFAPGGATEWRVTYDDYRFVEDPLDDQRPRRGVVMPFSVRFEDPRRDQDTLVRFQEVDLNVEVPPGTFQQRPRPGLTIEEVTCD